MTLKSEENNLLMISRLLPKLSSLELKAVYKIAFDLHYWMEKAAEISLQKIMEANNENLLSNEEV